MMSKTEELLERARACLQLGEMTDSRGNAPSNVYNVLSDLIDALARRSSDVGGVTEETLREALRFIPNIDNAHPVVRKLRSALTAALAVGDEGMGEGWQPIATAPKGEGE